VVLQRAILTLSTNPHNHNDPMLTIADNLRRMVFGAPQSSPSPKKPTGKMLGPKNQRAEFGVGEQVH
jgi:hypothetical protein